MKENPVRFEGEHEPSQRTTCILVVEDEVLVRMFVSDALRDAGYSVIEAISGDEAVDILDSGVVVDLVFTDVRMPGAVDGLGLLVIVRRDFPALPVVITSGHLAPAYAFADGATGFLAKPYGVDEAIKLITSALVGRQ